MNRREQFKDIEYSVSEGADLTQYTFEDYRIYVDNDGEVFASVTTILDEIKADPFLQMWKDTNGSEAVNQVLRRAADSGTKVHNTIEQLCIDRLNGVESQVFLLDEWGKLKFTEEEWCGVIRFVDFFDNFVDEIIMTEQRLSTKTYMTAGTVDAIFVLKDGRTVLIDFKFANHLSPKYAVQTWIYKFMWEQSTGQKIDGRANLWLKAHTRGRDKSGKKIQGESWQLVFHEEDERDELVWNAAHTLFFDRYRDKPLQPLHRIYPTKLTLQ
jgi:hypothetical protein